MPTFKRILVQLKTRIGQVVDDFENHEALAGVAIQEVENIARSSRVQLNRVRNRSRALDKKIEALHADKEKWAERAVRLADESPENALNCVKRIKQAEKEIEILCREQNESLNQEQKIATDLNRICEQLAQMKTRKENLIARQHLAQTCGIPFSDYRNPAESANAVFDRWESRVVGDEFEAPDARPHDAFAEGFELEEYEDELKKTLQDLVDQARKS